MNIKKTKDNKNIWKNLKKLKVISKLSNINVNDMEVYLASLIFMDICRLPNYRDHWFNDPLFGSLCKNIIGIQKLGYLENYAYFTFPPDSIGKNQILPLTKKIQEKIIPNQHTFQ